MKDKIIDYYDCSLGSGVSYTECNVCKHDFGIGDNGAGSWLTYEDSSGHPCGQGQGAGTGWGLGNSCGYG